mmetsp:Transcript_51329/g.116691  ORF Transcript_51329/g.116691 Transcript_51329/m.116691 type:complete len:213 (+) Transcript_51329:617-1255(+)
MFSGSSRGAPGVCRRALRRDPAVPAAPVSGLARAWEARRVGVVESGVKIEVDLREPARPHSLREALGVAAVPRAIKAPAAETRAAVAAAAAAGSGSAVGQGSCQAGPNGGARQPRQPGQGPSVSVVVIADPAAETPLQDPSPTAAPLKDLLKDPARADLVVVAPACASLLPAGLPEDLPENSKPVGGGGAGGWVRRVVVAKPNETRKEVPLL